MSIRKVMVAGMMGAAALLPTHGAGATDLKLSLGAAGEYDSNIFHREEKVRDDFVVIGIPRLELLDTEGKFTYDVGYSFPYQYSIKTNALRDFNQIANVSADYHLSDQTQLSFSDDFSYLNALNTNFNNTPTVASNEKRHRVLNNDANLGAVYLISPRLTSQTSFDQAVFSTSQNDRSDNQSYTLATGLDYLLTERHRAGGGVSVSYLNFDKSTDDASSTSVWIGPFLSWTYQIDEQSRLRVTGGPSWVRDDRDAFNDPANPPPEAATTQTRWAGLGRVSLDRRWSPVMISGIEYQRRQDTASGVSGSAILDAVSLTHAWNFTETWALALRGDWTSRKSATGVNQGVDDLDTQRWGAGAVLSKQITRNFSGSLRYQYGKQSSQGNSAGSSSDFDAHIVTLGFNYSLDPIKVW